jgi:phosphatidyl-myo-inositol alpha-mannosyltransferase
VFVDRLAREQSTRGHDVHVAAYTPPSPDAPYDWVRLGPLGLGRSKLSRLLLNPLLLNRVRWPTVDVLHLHGDDWFFTRRSTPTVRTFYGSSLFEGLTATSTKRRVTQLATFPLERRSARLATACFGIGPDSDTLYSTDGRLPLGVDAGGVLRPLRERECAILFVGTWKGRKRGEALYGLFRQVRAAVPDAELWMVSDHCEPAAGVIWHNAPDDSRLAELYSRARVFCLPSSYEGFGLPYIEALASGTPPVSTPNFGAEMVLQGGRFGPIVELERLSGELVSLLTDDPRWQELSDCGPARAADYSWDACVEAHTRAYRTAIDRYG